MTCIQYLVNHNNIIIKDLKSKTKQSLSYVQCLDLELEECANLCTEIKHKKRLVFNSLSVGSDTNLSHPEFPRVTGGPGGGFRDVVDIIICQTTQIIMHSGSK